MSKNNLNLELLNLGKTEYRLYIELAEQGKGTAQQLSKRTKIKRTTVYSSLSSLAQKNLVTSEKRNSTTYYYANKPENILKNLDQEKQVLNNKNIAMKEFIAQVAPFFSNKSTRAPKVKFVEGFSEVNDFLYEYSDIWMNSVLNFDNIWWGYQDNTFVDQYKDWLWFYWNKKPNEQKIQLLSNISKTELELKGKVKSREIRTIGDEIIFTSTIWICGEYVVMISSKSNPHYAFQIRDKSFSENLRNLFRLLWAKS